MSKVNIPKYGNFPLDALEEIEYAVDHGTFKKGDKNKVHPNTAILYRFKGIVQDKKAKKVDKPKEPKKQEVFVAPEVKKVEKTEKPKAKKKAKEPS